MAGYTNSETVTMTGGTLVGPSTIADINSTGEDVCARVFTAGNVEPGIVCVACGGRAIARRNALETA